MRILSFNVNGIRAIEKKGFLEWLSADSPDILCIGETKASPEQLPPNLTEPLDGAYHTYWASAKKRGYSGVAVFSKKEPLDVSTFGIGQFDDEGRVLTANYDDFVLITAYFPNSQEERKRLSYKLDFFEAMKDYCAALVKNKKHFILCGDYNVAHKPIDLAHPKQNENNPGYYIEEREMMTKFLDAGFVDTFRHFYPTKEKAYSWWSYRANARANNTGWRIDYHCVDKEFIHNIKDSIIRTDVTGSDHCPVELVL